MSSSQAFESGKLAAFPAHRRVAETPAPSKAALLRAELLADELSFLMEAHSGLSAKIAEEAGFKGIWASGLSISAALGVRDSNEASWTQVLELLEFMGDATSIPILLDGDTGYGNFNNVRRLVKKLCQRGIAGVCLEDKLFPKTNSFIGERQPLADMDEFCGKIKAGKDSQSDNDFSIVARVEALISGWGLDEALRRAEAYRAAGADAILIHSKKSTADEIVQFATEWDRRCPLVIVPTMYYATPTPVFEEVGVSTVIWANHLLRASIKAMRETAQQIMDDRNVLDIEDGVASVKDIFEIVGNHELSAAEKRYLPQKPTPKAIILAASRGSELGHFTEDLPKCMLDVRGQPLLKRLISTFHEGNVGDVTVVRGYRKEMVNVPATTMVDNDDYEHTGEVASLFRAADQLEGNCLVTYGDILFRRHILDQLLEAEGDVVLVADANWQQRQEKNSRSVTDYICCDRTYTGHYLEETTVRLSYIGTDPDPEAICGEWIGLAKLSTMGTAWVRQAMSEMEMDGSLAGAGMPDLLNRLMAAGREVKVVYVTGHWLDVNNAFDLAQARNFT